MGYCRMCLEQETHLYQIDSKVKEIIRSEFEVDINPQDTLSHEICRKCKEKAKEFKNLKAFKDRVIKNQCLIKQVANIKKKEVSNNERKTQQKDEKVSKLTSKRKQLDATSRKKQDDIVVQVAQETSATDITVQVPVEAIADASKSRKKSRPENATAVTSHKLRSNSKTDSSAIQSAEVGTSVAINSNPIASTSTGVIETNGSATDKEVISLDDDAVVVVTKEKLIPLDDLVIVATNEEVIPLDDTLVNIKTEPNIPDHPCTFCNKSYYFVESLNTHHRRQHSNISKCPKCPRWFKLRKTFCAHMRAHLGVKLPQRMCGTCFKVCNSSKELAQHRKLTHETVNLVCNLCNKKFSSSTELKRHKRSHRIQNNKDFTCKRCKKKFLTALLEEKHQCTVLKFVCPNKCGKRFKDSSTLNTHSMKCSALTTFKCEFRPKKLTTSTNLEVNLTRCTEPSSTPATGTSESSDTNKAPVPEERKLVELDNQTKEIKNSAVESRNAEEISFDQCLPNKASSSKTEPFKQTFHADDVIFKETNLGGLDKCVKISSPIMVRIPLKSTNIEKNSIEARPIHRSPDKASSTRTEPRKSSFTEEKTNSGEFDEHKRLTERWSKNLPCRSSNKQSNIIRIKKSSRSSSHDRLSREKSPPLWLSPTPPCSSDRYFSTRDKTSKMHEKKARFNHHSVSKANYHHSLSYKPQYKVNTRFDESYHPVSPRFDESYRPVSPRFDESYRPVSPEPISGSSRTLDGFYEKMNKISQHRYPRSSADDRWKWFGRVFDDWD